jgi:diguanylate cyclase (GGDEF)-like protein
LSTKSEALDALIALLARNGLGSFLENIRTLVVALDAQGETTAWNPAFDRVREASPGATSLQALLPESAAAIFQASLEAATRTLRPVRLALEIGGLAGRAHHDCTLIPLPRGRFVLIAEPVLIAKGEPADSSAAATQLIKVTAELHEARMALDNKQTELHAVLAQTDEVVHTDALTLLPNHRWVIADLQRQVTYTERYGAPLSISMIDLDHFKDINDTHGHIVGDQVLRFIASELRDRIRQPDEIGRYGGDEFLVILPNTTLTAAADQATRLCKQLRSTPVIAGKNVISVSISIGIAQYRPNADDWHSLLERADQALYQSKHNGGDQWAILDA